MKKITRIVLSTILLIAVCFTSVAFASTIRWGTVNTKSSGLNLCGGASSTQFSVLTTLKKGSKLFYTDKVYSVTVHTAMGSYRTAYSKVVTASGQTGYACKSYLKSSGSTSSGNVYVATTGVNMRKEASTSSKKVGALKKGEPMRVTKKYSSKWYKVIKLDGKEGYVSTDYIKSAF